MKKIKFIKDFSSPVYGNVWVNRIISVKPTEAEKLIALGHAVFADEKIEEIKEKYQEKVEENGDSEPKRSKKSSKGRSKR